MSSDSFIEVQPEPQQEVSYSEHPETVRAIGILAVGKGPNALYRAAHPGYPANFTRDSLVTLSYLSGDIDGTKAQLAFSAKHQGTKPDEQTGEEPGKIHHEMLDDLNGVEINGLNSRYNACDTTALFLSRIACLAEIGEKQPLIHHRENIERAIDYIGRHISRNGLFEEDPKHSGASRYGLKVTYWKDSILNHQDRVEPHYPVVYTQSHFQNAEALTRIAQALGHPELERRGRDMTAAGNEKLWVDDHFVTAIDASGVIDASSSDSLHSLLFIPPKLLGKMQARQIQKYMKGLETKAGYLTGTPVAKDRDPYHTDYLWVHEQALLHMAAVKHQLGHAAMVASRIQNYIGSDKGFPELLDPAADFMPAGNNPQLWAIGTHRYFQRPNRALI